MPGLGDLVVNLTANTAKFKAGIAGAKSALSGFGDAAKSLLSPGKIALAGIGAAAASTAVGIYAINNNIAKLDAVAKQAAKTGLSGAFLQRLEFAADQSGVSAETLTSSIKKLTINIGEAVKGNDSLAQSFADIGISVADLQSMSPEEQFRAVVEQIAKLPTAADRASAAVKLLGRGGFDMVTLLNGGVGGLNDLLHEAESIGIGVSADDLKKIEAANDAWGRMKAAIGAVWDQITVAMAPALTSVATAIGNVVARFDNVGESIASVINILGDWVTTGVGYMEDFASVAVVLAGNYQLVWQVALENLPKIAKATLEWITANTTIAMKNMLTGVQNVWAKIEQKSRQLGEWIAYQTGISDEMLTIPEPVMQQFSAMEAFTAPDWSQSATELGTTIADAIAANETARIETAKREATGTQLSALESSGIGELAAQQIETGSPKIAGAMQRGSAEAYSTIVQAMITRGKDPVVKATETQTKQLLAGMAANRPQFAVVEAFA